MDRLICGCKRDGSYFCAEHKPQAGSLISIVAVSLFISVLMGLVAILGG